MPSVPQISTELPENRQEFGPNPDATSPKSSAMPAASKAAQKQPKLDQLRQHARYTRRHPQKVTEPRLRLRKHLQLQEQGLDTHLRREHLKQYAASARPQERQSLRLRRYSKRNTTHLCQPHDML